MADYNEQVIRSWDEWMETTGQDSGDPSDFIDWALANGKLGPKPQDLRQALRKPVTQALRQFKRYDEDGGFTYQNAPAIGPPPKPAERMVFDPKTGHAQHSRIAPDETIRLGYYKIDGDRLTLNLNNAPGPRPKGLEPEANSTIWHLQRVEAKK